MTTDRQTSSAPRSRLAARIGNPLEYSFVDKTILMATITALVVLLGWLTMHLMHTYADPDSFVSGHFGQHSEESHGPADPGSGGNDHPDQGPHDLHEEGLSFIEYSFLAILVLELIIIGLGLILKKRSPNGLTLPYLYAVLTSASIVFIYDLAGHSNNLATLLILFAQMLFGLLLFNLTFVGIVFGTWAVLTGMLYLGESAGWIPHLVDLIASHESQEEFLPIIRLSIQSFSWLLMGLILVLSGYIISQWRVREAQVVEYSGVLKKMFGQYLSTQVMNSLLENPADLALGGERRRVTIMMADLRGFSSLAEALKPEQVVDVVNHFCEVMIEVIMEYEGTIIEILGDALLVVFGAPEKMDDRAERAIACALTMQRAMDGVNQRNRKKGLPRLEMGIGLNDSEVIVGNIGSSKRSKYGVVGPGVNMASRIESLTVGGQVLISESLYREVRELLRIDGQKQFQPKGSEHSVNVYEVGGIAGRYNLAVKRHEDVLRNLSQPILLNYSVISGKSVGQDQKECRLVRLGQETAEVLIGQPIKGLTNLRLSLSEVDALLADKQFYAKVLERAEDDPSRHLIRFTSLPAEVDAYLQAVRKLGVSQTKS